MTEGTDGLVRVYRAANMNGRFPLIRVSTPRDEPILVQITSFSADLADPALRIVDAVGEVVTKADSLRFREYGRPCRATAPTTPRTWRRT